MMADQQQRQERGPSKAEAALAIATLFPVGGLLLTLAGLTLTLTVIGLTTAFPLFLLFSPVLLPAAAAIGMALAGFLASGTMGIAAVRALSWLFGYMRCAVAPPENIVAGSRTKDVGGVTATRAHQVHGQI